jgi:hypothetical protein
VHCTGYKLVFDWLVDESWFEWVLKHGGLSLILIPNLGFDLWGRWPIGLVILYQTRDP